jgi:hypothetical protein
MLLENMAIRDFIASILLFREALSSGFQEEAVHTSK